MPNILSNHVALHVHHIARLEIAERRVAERIVDQRQLHHRRLGDGVDRQAHAIDGDRPVRHEQLCNLARHCHVHEDCVAGFSDAVDRSDAIDVALHDVAAEPVGRLEGTLEVHTLARRPIAHRRPTQRSNDRRDREPAIGPTENG